MKKIVTRIITGIIAIGLAILLMPSISPILHGETAWSLPTYTKTANSNSIISATGADVPIDTSIAEEYRFPVKYQNNAVQFRTEDGVLLCGWVLGSGTNGITLGHANGWSTTSWLPFAERLVDAGYMVIILEFRNLSPSGDAAPGAEQRWDLDILAAAQVLRERGATQILAMGASDGGNATAVATPHIPDLVGIGILSSPARSKGDGPAALAQISVPAFFAVSNNDPGVGGGDGFLKEVQALYDACASEQKELHVLTSYEHGTDLLSAEDAYSAGAYGGSSEAQKQERRQLADDLMRFVNDAFGVQGGGDEGEETGGDNSGNGSAAAGVSNTGSDSNATSDAKQESRNSISTTLLIALLIVGGLALLGIAALIIRARRAKQNSKGHKFK